MWKTHMEQRGPKVNMGKTKLLVTGGIQMELVQFGRYSCGVCGWAVWVNSVLRVACNKWCHKRCSGLRSLNQVVNFRCPACNWGRIGDVVGEDIGVDGEVVERVGEFCYLGDVMACEGGSDIAMKCRTAAAWLKW